MINWFSVFANSFWVVGLAVMLAGLSYYYWQATQTGRPLAQAFGSSPFQRVAVSGLLLIGIGLALTANGLWQVIPAALLILVCAVAIVALYRGRSNTPPAQ